MEYSGCVVHTAGQSLMQNQVKGFVFTALSLRYPSDRFLIPKKELKQ